MQSTRADNAANLVVRHGRVMDPARGIDAILDVVIKDGHIQALVEPSEEYSCPEIDASGKLVVPGMIDLHTHVYWGGSSISIRLEDHLIRSGVTTWVDAGSAGAGNFKAFKQYSIDLSPVRILAFLNISFADITVLELEAGRFEFQDCFGNVRKSESRLKPTDLIFGGSVICRSGASTLRPKN